MFTFTRTITLSGVFGAALALVACTAVAPMAPATPLPAPVAGELTLVDVRARAAPLEGGNSAAYLLVLNGRDEAVRLLSAASDVAAAVELHETINDNGVMKMEPRAEGFEIPAGGVLELKPGGKHVMLLGLAAPLEAGDSVDLTLTFDTGEELKVRAPVIDLGAPMQMQDEGMHGEGDRHGEDTDEHADMADGEHEAVGDHGAMMAAMPAALVDAYAALPLDALHDMDTLLMAGAVEPGFGATVKELQAGIAAIEWPEPVQAQVEPIRQALDELATALEGGDAATAAALAAKVHGLMHELEFIIEPPQ